jgi:3-dehydroquinate dehydratase
MKVTFKQNSILVERENTDPKFYGLANAKGESALLYAIKTELNKQGYDLIKKRMHKDGHLVDDIQQYLRTRKKGAGKADVYIYDASFALRDAAADFNKGAVELALVENVF